MNRKHLGIMIMCLLLLGVCNRSAKAWVWSSEQLSSTSVAGQYIIYPTQISLPYGDDYYGVCGGDVQANLYNGTRGLESTFYWNTGRTIMVMVLEMDGSSSSSTRLYLGSFTNDDGCYRPVGWWCDEVYNTNSFVEVDGQVELRLKVFVQQHSLDTSTSVPSKIFKYKLAVID